MQQFARAIIKGDVFSIWKFCDIPNKPLIRLFLSPTWDCPLGSLDFSIFFHHVQEEVGWRPEQRQSIIASMADISECLQAHLFGPLMTGDIATPLPHMGCW